MRKTVRCLLIALMLLMTMAPVMASAAADVPAEAEALFQSALPSHTIVLADACGNTAAAALTDGQTLTLCVAENQGGAWQLAVCNPTALRQDEQITGLLLDTDETLYWTYGSFGLVCDTYRASRQDGQWRMISLVSRETFDNGRNIESHTWYAEGRLNFASYTCDENDNVTELRPFAPVPARWLEGLMALDAYDDARFPKPDQNYTHSWLSDEATALAAAELFPEDTYLGGCARREHVEFFLQRPDGEKIIAACQFDEKKGWQITRSTPLPQGTTYGYENFSSSLVIGDLLVNVGPTGEGTCGITHIYNMADMASGETMFRLGRNWISDGSALGWGSRFGDHPWADLSAMDWNTLPHTLEEALQRMDTSRWAVVSNPNPEDRLHLRREPAKTAASLGKYYNGTPVRTLADRGDWVQVDIFGITGWMMKDYLAFGEDGHSVEAAFPARTFADDGLYHGLFAQPATNSAYTNFDDPHGDLLVLGIVGEDWYHVWFPEEDLTGYVRQCDWQEGNG